MLPLTLDLSRLEIALVGTGAAALRRLRLLEDAGACQLAVYGEAPTAALAAAAGTRLRRHWPSPPELAAARVVFIADVPSPRRAALADAARAGGALVHVEDAPDLSDAHAPAVLRRGALTIAISTGGASPALAAELKRFLGGVFGPEWSRRVDRLAKRRRAWRADGADPATIGRLTRTWLGRRTWLAAARTLAARHARVEFHVPEQEEEDVSETRRNRSRLHARIDPRPDPLL